MPKDDDDKKDDEKKADDPRAAEIAQKRAEAAARKKEKADKKTAAPAELKVYKRTKRPRIQELYHKEVVPKLIKEFGYKNVMEVPRLVKISLNMGLGKATTEPKIIDSGAEELRAISGQAPVITKAKKDIAVFKLRKGLKIGAAVTLRRERMWEFFDRFVSIALPRVRDFRGISPKSFDGRGNFSTGIKEQIIFPEINYDEIDAIKGLNVSIVTTAKTDNEARALLQYLGMPFRGATTAQGGAAA
jgi:large subunit ribosomal protein L5